MHSYRDLDAEPKISLDWTISRRAITEENSSRAQKGNVMACQFHPEKSGATGLGVFQRFLEDAEPR